jgi:hypothetical protein
MCDGLVERQAAAALLSTLTSSDLSASYQNA